MTERNAASVSVEAEHFQIGASSLSWENDSLVIDVSETMAPLPAPMRGRIRVSPAFINNNAHEIDDGGRHRWRPIAPSAHVEVVFDKPSVKWSGHGYFDTNSGDEPLEESFRYWDWCRAVLPHGETAIFYNTDLWNGGEQRLALKLTSTGEITRLIPRPEVKLPSTKIWRIARRTRADDANSVRILRTLEDTPFYSRSIVESKLFGSRCKAVHESFSGGRFRSPIVKAMLPFRMPRFPASLS